MGEVKTDFAQSCETLQEDENGADGFSTSHNRAKLLELVRNCWSSCEIVFFLDFLVKKPLKDLLDDAKCPLDLDL